MFAQGGGGALLLVLLKVDSADLYGETMTSLEDVPFFSPNRQGYYAKIMTENKIDFNGFYLNKIVFEIFCATHKPPGLG